MNDKTTGLYQKYLVKRTGGKSGMVEKHDGCEYFVLDLTHDKHAIKALISYANSCRVEYPELAKDLREIVVTMTTKKQGRHNMACNICGVGLHKTNEHYLGWDNEALTREILNLAERVRELEDILRFKEQDITHNIEMLSNAASRIAELQSKLTASETRCEKLKELWCGVLDSVEIAEDKLGMAALAIQEKLNG